MKAANTKKQYEVTQADLPLSCPMSDQALWNVHPRVYLPIEKTGKARCAYCSTEYVLTDFAGNVASHAKS